MDDDHRELVRRVFASATELIETAHDAAVAGQSGEIAAGDHAEAARRRHDGQIYRRNSAEIQLFCGVQTDVTQRTRRITRTGQRFRSAQTPAQRSAAP